MDIGKRHACAECGQVVICVKPGAGVVACCGKPMELVQAQKLPASD